MFKCCYCSSVIRMSLCSYTRNSNSEEKLCEHFNVIYSYKTHYAFFSLGWSIEMVIKARCRECWNVYTLCDKTFRNGKTSDDDYLECHDRVFCYGIRGNNYGCDYQGTRRQKDILYIKKQKEREERERKEREEKLRKEKMEKLRKEKEERERKEKEERERKEREERKRKEREHLKIINNLNERIYMEENLNINMNHDMEEIIENENTTDWFDEELEKINLNAERKFNDALDINIVEEMKKLYNFQIVKK